MSRTNFEKLAAYRLAERLADEAWEIVIHWDSLARDTVGRQLVRAVDSIGASTAEGVGRGSHADNRRVVCTARGSLNETHPRLRRAFRCASLSPEQTARPRPLVGEVAPRLSAYLKSIDRFSGVT